MTEKEKKWDPDFWRVLQEIWNSYEKGDLPEDLRKQIFEIKEKIQKVKTWSPQPVSVELQKWPVIAEDKEWKKLYIEDIIKIVSWFCIFWKPPNQGKHSSYWRLFIEWNITISNDNLLDRLGYGGNDDRWLEIKEKLEKENTAFMRLSWKYLFIRVKNNRNDPRRDSHITIAIAFNNDIKSLGTSPDAINSLFHKLLELGNLGDFQEEVNIEKVIDFDNPILGKN